MDSPLVRGGLTLVAGVLIGNALGFVRVAGVTAYLLGTHSRADSLAVAMGPVDTLNSVLINSLVFAFVPMLTACKGAERDALFRKLSRGFWWACAAVTAAVFLSAPWLMRALAPGLDPQYFDTAVGTLRILSFSTLAAGVGAVQCALLYTRRRFGPTAFYQAILNIFTIAGALLLWKLLGVYAFAIGYSVGAWVQLAWVWFVARQDMDQGQTECTVHWREILTRPMFFVVYAAGLAVNITFTRAYATHAGPGMAAALDYCMRGVAVPMALLVNPISNALLPEISRLRSAGLVKDAFRLIDKTLALVALAAVAACTFAMVFRKPAIALLFERGSFTAESTALVSAAFLGLAPSLISWTLLEIGCRSLFALDRPWVPVVAATVPVVINVGLTLQIHSYQPEWLGLGASVGLLVGFLVLIVMMHASRSKWMVPMTTTITGPR